MPSLPLPSLSIFRVCRLPSCVLCLIAYHFLHNFGLLISGFEIGAMPSDDAFVMHVPVPLPSNFSDELHFAIILPRQEMKLGTTAWIRRKTLVALHDALQDYAFSTSMLTIGFDCKALLGFAQRLQRTVVIVHSDDYVCKCGGKSTNMIHVRWLLGRDEIQTEVSRLQDDLVFEYLKPDSEGCDNTLLVVPQLGKIGINSTECKKGEKERSGTASFGGEPHKQIDSVQNFKTMRIEDELFSTLCSFTYFFTYDPYTFLTWSAAILGAIPIVNPISNVTKEEWALKTFAGLYLQYTGKHEVPGIAYGWSDEEVHYANHSIDEMEPFLEEVRRWGTSVTVPRFTRDVYRYKHGIVGELECSRVLRHIDTMEQIGDKSNATVCYK
mmetsp:Transcript_5516/g.12980  ORF Transcript_5516/g.12980 Transcript_5516/m.12980 type:complete len:382 (-) Transcript_5516:1261-2406(-)